MNSRKTMLHYLSTVLASILICTAVWAQDTHAEVNGGQRDAAPLTLDQKDLLERRLAEMSPEDVRDYLLKKQELRMADDFNPFVNSEVLPVIAVLMVFGMPVMIIGLIVFYKYKRRRALHETIRVMVEKGVEIPPDLFEEERQPNSALRKGIVLVAVGLGLIGFFVIEGGSDGVGIGLIPLFIGAAYLIIWKLEGGTIKADRR